MDNNKRKKSFWYTVSALVCIAIYILIPVLKVIGVIEDYNATLTSFLIIVGAVLYMVGRRADVNTEEEEDDPSKHFENTEVIEEAKDGE